MDAMNTRVLLSLIHKVSRIPIQQKIRVTMRVSGIKRHLIVDSQGLPHGMLVTTANCTDRQGALDVMSQNQATLKHVDVVLVDGGYTGKVFSSAVQDLIGARVEVAKRSE